MTDILNWGIISTARINRRVLPPIKQAGRSKLMAVASRDGDKARAYADEWGIPLSFGTYEAMLAAPEIDAVYIPLPNSMHHEWAIKAAAAGKHILCEKPLALTVAEVDEMVSAAAANGVVLMEAFMYQTHPQLAKLKAVIKEGLIGRIQLIKAQFSFTLPATPENSRNIRLIKAVGGGAVWDVGCYPVSFCQAIASEPPAEVFAYQQLGETGVDVVLAAQLKYAGGAIAQIDCGFRLPYRVGAEVIGDKGRLVIPQPWQPDTDGRSSGLIHIAPDDTQTPIATQAIDPYLCEIEAMERAVLDGEPLPYTLAASRNNIATINAMYESAETGKAVRVVK